MKRLHILAIGLLIAFAVSLQAVQSVINVGSSANDGTGDTLRSAMQKVNSNFTELYGTIFNFNANQFGASSSTNIYIKSGATLTNTALYGSTSGSWTVGTTGNLTADTARTVTTTSGSLTLASGSSHVVLSPSSNVGVGTTGPDAKLDVLSTSGSQYRATYTDGSVYSDWGTLSTGATLWTNSLGHRITSTTVNDTSVLARQVQGGLAFDGTATTGASATIGAVGLSDCTLHFTYRVPDTAITSGSYSIGIQSATGSTGNGDFAARLNSNGIDVLLQAGGLYTRVSFNPITLYAGKVITVDIIRSSATTLTTYINGVATTFSDVSSTTTPNLIDLTSTVFREWCSAACDKPITVSGATLFNRALSASEVITLANQGVQEADKSGNLTGQTSGTLTRGKRYRITTFVAGDSFTNVGAASNATGVEFVATGTTPTTWTNASTLNQIGSILDADLSAGVGYQVPDRSSNKYHGVVSATGTSWTQANRRGQIRYTTTGATTGAFQLLSGTAIPANALIQSIVAWSAGTPLIYVGTATGTSNVVGHTTLVGSTYTPLTLSSQFSTTGNLWINKSATNEVNLTVNYMISDP